MKNRKNRNAEARYVEKSQLSPNHRMLRMISYNRIVGTTTVPPEDPALGFMGIGAVLMVRDPKGVHGSVSPR